MTNTPDSIIKHYSQMAAISGAIPIPVLDVVKLMANQQEMIKELANYYNVDYSSIQQKATIAVYANCPFGKTGSSLVKFIPIVGSIAGGTTQTLLAGASTFALGNAFNFYFRQEKRLDEVSFDGIKSKYQEYLEKGKQLIGQWI